MLALHLLNALAVILAWACARRIPTHRPVAFTLAAGFAAELAREALVGWALPPAAAPPDAGSPLGGALLWAVFLDGALFIAWPALLAACSLRVLAERRTWPIAIVYTAAAVALAAMYPATRGSTLRHVYLGMDLAACLVGLASFGSWLARSWGRRRADLAVTAAAVLVTGHLAAVVAGPYRFGLFGAEWYLMQLAYVMLFSVLILLQGGALWTWKQSAS